MRKRCGFSLFESTISIILAALLLCIGVPSLNQIVQNNRLISQTDALVASLKLAHQASMTHHATVTVCASDNQTSCDNSESWQSGWIVFTDAGQPGVVDGSDEILQVSNPVEHGMALAVTGENTIRYQVMTQQAYVCMDCREAKQHSAAHADENRISGFIHDHLPFSDVLASTREKKVRQSSSVNGNSEISICDSTRSGETGRVVVISMIGRVSTANKQCD